MMTARHDLKVQPLQQKFNLNLVSGFQLQQGIAADTCLRNYDVIMT